ncbi:unnamed protein product [marine sediment metagenome]|uniref:Uncharacterized protein n=1 Tax=marine sediment metagenome TaxID=412755 RepID=X0Z7S6_9ZZZZ
MRATGKVVSQFAEYNYSAALGAGVIYKPVAGTIIMTAEIATKQDLDIYDAAVPIKVGTDSMGANEYAWIGPIYCDGSDIGFKNVAVGAGGFILWGLTMA